MYIVLRGRKSMVKRRKDFLNELAYIDGITIIDTSGTILFSVKFNPRFHPEIEDHSDVVGKKLFEIFTNIDRESSTLIKAMELGKPIHKRRQKVINIDGECIQTANASIPIKSKGRIIGAVELSKDISKHKYEYSNEIIMNSELFKSRNIINEYLGPHKARYTLEEIISNNDQIKELKHIVKKIAIGRAPVFIYGETGTGKELFAHSIHNESERAGKPFVSQNCAAIPENLLESILFGTTKGSFTGAYDTPGLFELAEGGTLFLDEINSMPLNLQAKMLRVLEDGYVRRLGDRKERRIDVRIITASNNNPQRCLREGKLRHDIYYRLSVLVIGIPPLRERKDDIELLLNFFVDKYNKILNKNINKVSKEVYDFLKAYKWPGNVRELEHVVEYAMHVVSRNENIIEMEHVNNKIKEIININEKETELDIQPLNQAILEVEKDLIGKAINKTKGNVSAAARLLCIPRQTLQRKIDKYNIK
jgi:arginine utilization regulatory protein